MIRRPALWHAQHNDSKHITSFLSKMWASYCQTIDMFYEIVQQSLLACWLP